MNQVIQKSGAAEGVRTIVTGKFDTVTEMVVGLGVLERHRGLERPVDRTDQADKATNE